MRLDRPGNSYIVEFQLDRIGKFGTQKLKEEIRVKEQHKQKMQRWDKSKL